MTVTTTANSATYDGDGLTTTFDVPFQFFDSTDLIVTERIVSTGAETVLSLTTDYSVSGGGGDVGQVIANSAPLATVKWSIRRATSQTQLIDYTDHDPFPAETHETGLDRVTLIAQDSASEVARSLTFPSADDSNLSAVIPNSVLRASKYLAFDANGEPIASAGPTGDSGVPVSSFISGQLFDDTDAATARATLGLDAVSQAEAEAGTATGERTWTAQRVAQAIAALAPLPRGYIDGLTLSMGTLDDSHDIEIAVGECRDSAGAADLRLTSALSKQIDVSWDAGGTPAAPAGGLFSGSVAINTWYHCHLIRSDADGSIDAGFDTSASAANIPVGYTAYRRLGSVRTDGVANIHKFTQRGDTFRWFTASLDYNINNPGTSATTVTLDLVPTGLVVDAHLMGQAENAGAATALVLTAGTDNDQGPDGFTGFGQSSAVASTEGFTSEVFIPTNESAQIRARVSSSSANADIRIWVRGWIDRRGKDA